jgi:hypothetical protein
MKTIRIEFPALDALVAYLQGNQQSQLDGMAKQIQSLTERLHKSELALRGAEPQPK